MQQVNCSSPVQISQYVKQALSKQQPIQLKNVLDKPIGNGFVNLSLVKFIAKDNDLIILPA